MASRQLIWSAYALGDNEQLYNSYKSLNGFWGQSIRSKIQCKILVFPGYSDGSIATITMNYGEKEIFYINYG